MWANQLRERNLGLLALLGAFVLFFLATVAMCHCAPGQILGGDPGPCGARWHSCGDGSCCEDSFVCGGPMTGCPPASCCFAGSDDYGAARDGGARVEWSVVKPRWTP